MVGRCYNVGRWAVKCTKAAVTEKQGTESTSAVWDWPSRLPYSTSFITCPVHANLPQPAKGFTRQAQECSPHRKLYTSGDST